MAKKVSIQGQKASFHDIAAKVFFKEPYQMIGCDSFKDTVHALVNGHSEYAVLAIENSLFGSINVVYDLLRKNNLWIIGEIFLRIEQCLIGLPGAKLSDISEVYSQLEALAQCEDFLDSHLPHASRHELHDTAASVAYVKSVGVISKAAIGSSEAAKLHGLRVLKSGIETNRQNFTRFVVLQKHRTPVLKANKTSLIMETSHTTGSLYNALSAFAQRDINLTKLQSRPLVGKAWHYLFYVDAASGIEEKKMQAAIQDLNAQGCKITVLGSYQAAIINH